MIWFKPYTLEDISKRNSDSLVTHLGIEITELGADFIVGTIPVSRKTCQPLGILHGGASVVLAETLGSVAANLVVNPDKQYCVGLEVNANHLRPAKVGEVVTGIAKPIHLGQKTQVWEIKLQNEQGKSTCISRLTMAVVDR